MAAVQISHCPFIKYTASPSIQQKYSLLKSWTLLHCSPLLYLRIPQLLISTWGVFYYFHILLREWICSIPSFIFRSQPLFISVLFLNEEYLHQGKGRHFTYRLFKALPPWFHYLHSLSNSACLCLPASYNCERTGEECLCLSVCVFILRGRRVK